MRKKINMVLIVIVSAFGLIKTKAPISAKAAGDKIPDAGNYLRLSGDDTDQCWITKEIGTSKGHGVVKFNHIVFFNSNPAWNIESIQHINYEIKRSDKTQPASGQVDNSRGYKLLIKDERKIYPLGTGNNRYFYDVYDYKKNNDSSSFNKVNEERLVIPNRTYAWYVKHYNFVFPEMGKTKNIRDLYQITAQVKPGLQNYLLYLYQNDNSFKTYYSIFSEFGSNYEYYLILPIESSIGVTVNYLSLTATDINGNVITDDAGVGDAEIDPETGDSFYTISVIKTNSQMETATAFYFPGSNRYKLTGVKLNSYNDNDEEKDYDIMFYAGNVIGKKTLKDIADSVTYITTLKRNGTYTLLNYTFNGDNNCVLLDIPNKVVDMKATIRFEKLNEDQGEVLMPFALNLLDENGNYGIEGALAADNKPRTLSKFWQWLKDLFNFGGERSPLQIFRQFMLIALSVVLLIALIKVISLIVNFIKLLRRKKED